VRNPFRRKSASVSEHPSGVVRVDARTKKLTKRLQPGEIAIIDHTDLDRVAARQTNALGVGCPVRGREQNIVAVIDHGSEGFIDRLLTTVCNKYLRRIDLNAGIAQGFIRDSLFELG